MLVISTVVGNNRSLNVLYIVADDLRPEFGFAGQVHMKTPNVDALAATAMVFDKASVNPTLCLHALETMPRNSRCAD